MTCPPSNLSVIFRHGITSEDSRQRCQIWIPQKHKFCTQIAEAVKCDVEGGGDGVIRYKAFCSVHARLLATTDVNPEKQEMTRKEQKKHRRKLALLANKTNVINTGYDDQHGGDADIISQKRERDHKKLFDTNNILQFEPCPFTCVHRVKRGCLGEHVRTCPYRTRTDTVLPDINASGGSNDSDRQNVNGSSCPAYFKMNCNVSFPEWKLDNFLYSKKIIFSELPVKERNDFLEWLDVTYKRYDIDAEIEPLHHIVETIAPESVTLKGVGRLGDVGGIESGSSGGNIIVSLLLQRNETLANFFKNSKKKEVKTHSGMLEAALDLLMKEAQGKKSMRVGNQQTSEVFGLLEWGAGKGGLLATFYHALNGTWSSSACVGSGSDSLKTVGSHHQLKCEDPSVENALCTLISANHSYGGPTIAIDKSNFRDLHDKLIKAQNLTKRYLSITTTTSAASTSPLNIANSATDTDSVDYSRMQSLPSSVPKHLRIKMDAKDLDVFELIHNSPSKSFWDSSTPQKLFSSEVQPPFSKPSFSIQLLDIKWLSIGKHLCGGCTDLAIKGVSEAVLRQSQEAVAEGSKRIVGLVIAPCCHQLCTPDAYVLHSGVKEKKMSGEGNTSTNSGVDQEKPTIFRTPRDILLCASISGWGTSIGKVKSIGRDSVMNKDENNGTDCIVGCSSISPAHGGNTNITFNMEKYRWGKRAKRLLDYGRLLFLRSLKHSLTGIHCFSTVKMIEYVDVCTTEENIIIVALC